jgi:hypothetical protein
MPEPARETKGAQLSIGALSRATGIPVETLRTWESRYGFPAPERRPSGHRLYSLSIVPRLRRVAEALARGHRAGQVVPASDADLRRLLAAEPTSRVGSPPDSPSRATGDVPQLLRLVESFESDRLSHALPVPDMVALTRDLGARALALSVSASGRKPRTAAPTLPRRPGVRGPAEPGRLGAGDR